MILIIMRHGEAVEYREPDFSRSLTEYGKQQCEKVGIWLGQNIIDLAASCAKPIALESASIDMTIVSPYLRTQQTLRAVSKGIRIAQQVTIDSVTPTGNAAQCADLIHGYASDYDAPKTFLVVSHMPLVSLLGDKVCKGFNTRFFEPADVLVIDYEVESGIGSQLAFFQG